MESKYSSKGDELMAQAKQKLKGSFFKNIMGSEADRAEEALQLYKQAATSFKMAKRWDDAANAYIECVNCDRVCKGGEAAEYYTQAANMKEKVNTGEAVNFLEKAIQMHVKTNNVSNAAKLYKRIAEIYEKDNEFSLAVKNYREAADLYEAENNRSSDLNNTLLKIVDLAPSLAQIDYAGTVKILEEVAERYISNKLTAPSAKDLFFRSVLLFLANDDIIGAKCALNRYLDKDPTLLGTRQEKFMTAIIKAIQEKNAKQFAQQCYNHNQIMALDKWKTVILNKAKATIPGVESAAAGREEKEEQL